MQKQSKRVPGDKLDKQAMKRSWLAQKFRVFSCEHYTELASRSLDHPLTLKESSFFNLHHLICLVCRRYNRQLSFIEMAAKRLSQDADYNDEIQSSSPAMSKEAKSRIKAKLAEVEAGNQNNSNGKN